MIELQNSSQTALVWDFAMALRNQSQYSQYSLHFIDSEYALASKTGVCYLQCSGLHDALLNIK